MFDLARLSRRQAVFSLLLSLDATRLLGVEAGEAAPRFVARTIDGERYTSDSLKGKVVLIEFWATWCVYCKKDEAALESITREFAKSDLVVLAVDMGEPRRKVKKYLESSPRSSKVVLAENTTLAAICEARTYPLYVLIDRQGIIAGTQHGAAGEGALRRLLGKAGLDS